MSTNNYTLNKRKLNGLVATISCGGPNNHKYSDCNINNFFNGWNETLKFVKSKGLTIPTKNTSMNNIPTIQTDCKEAVFGPLELLVSYMALPEYFNILSAADEVWSIGLNYLFIHCSINKKLPDQDKCNYPIRLLLNKKNRNRSLFNYDKTPRITAVELCTLISKYEIDIYLYDDNVERDHHIFFIKKKNGTVKLPNLKKVYAKKDTVRIYSSGSYKKIQI